MKNKKAQSEYGTDLHDQCHREALVQLLVTHWAAKN